MAKELKLYKVEIGMLDRKRGDVQNWSSKNVLARDAARAIKKVKLYGSEYVVGAMLITVVDQT